jgi:biotin transport system substrate-specific component
MENDIMITTKYEKIYLILLGTMFFAISAQMPLSVPLLPTEIPGTWQTFVILVFSFLTNRRVGFFAVLVYLIVGALGLPVFAEGSSGIDVLFGKTGGYLFGFLIGAIVVGYFGEQKEWQQKFGKILLAMLLGTIAILIIGMIVLGFFIGFKNGIVYGFTPFLLGAAIKIVLGAVFIKLIN